MSDVFHFILQSSLYAGIVGLVIIFIKLALKNRLSAKWHYLLWMVLVIKLLVPYGPESAVSLFNKVPEIPQQTMGDIAYQMEQRYETSLEAGTPLPYMAPTQQQVEAYKTAAMAESLLPYAWAAGAALMMLWLVFTCGSLHKKLRCGSPVTDERVIHIFEACKYKMGIDRNTKVPLIVQDAVGTPSLFGVRYPKILLPPAVFSLSDKELEYILLHELAHYRRKDVPVNYLLLFLQAVHWFNPVIWHCFRLIRHDMEVATDETVLSVIDSTEYKDYGRALLAVLEGVSTQKLAPRLLGMAEDRKNIERRLNMIKMAGFFKSRRKIALVLGLLCFAVLGAVLLTDGLTSKYPASGFTGYNAAALFKFKTPYVGDNSKVVNLVNNLPYAEMRGEISLQTESQPYGVTVDYDFSFADFDTRQIGATFRDNAVVLFALIDNVDVVEFNVIGADGPPKYLYTRAEVQKGYGQDLREYSKDTGALETLLNSFGFRLHAYPDKYAPIMSATPGIQIMAEYRGPAARARFATGNGALLTWDNSTGKVSNGLSSIELPLGTPVYWSPIDPAGRIFAGDKSPVTITLLDKQGKSIAEKQLVIIYDGSMYYTVQPAIDIVIGGEPCQKPVDIDSAVSQAIISRRHAYMAGETAVEGHIILDSEEDNERIKVYTIASFGAFGFENGIFTKVSGSGAIPTVMIFARYNNGGYSLLEYQEPEDGAGYTESIKKMFPARLQDRVLSSHGDYEELARQQEAQAAEYLKSIGRTTEVSAAHVKKQLADIDVDASNKLFSEHTKNDPFLNNCPYWIGARERIENGARYIYETAQGRTGDGYDLIVFRKTLEDGTVVEERGYKIVGGEPQLTGDRQ
jgi:beta-lactamase regulating signal transducer with metallopeptidase domain